MKVDERHLKEFKLIQIDRRKIKIAKPKLYGGDRVVGRESVFTQMHLHTDASTHRLLYTQTLLHKDPFTHRCFNTQTLYYTDVFIHKLLYTQAL